MDSAEHRCWHVVSDQQSLGMHDRSRRYLRAAFLIALISGLGCLLCLYGGVARDLELRTWDWRVRATASPTDADPRIAIVMIDQSSLEHFAEHEKIFWPWPRALYEPVVRFLERAGARGVAFDILFTEQSSYGVEDDQAFAEAARKATIPVVHAVAHRRKGSQAEAPAVALLRERSDTLLGPRLNDLAAVGGRATQASSLTVPVPDLIASAAGFGSVSADPDPDGVFRRAMLAHHAAGTTLPSLPTALFLATGGSPAELRRANASAAADGSLALRFHGPARTYTTMPFDAVVRSFQALEEGSAPIIAPSSFAGRWVFVGMDAPGLLDLRPTPVGKVYPGVEFHATALDNLLHGAFVHHPELWMTVLGCFALFALSAGVALLTQSAAIRYVFLATLGAGIVLGAMWAADHGVWIELFMPLVWWTVTIVVALAVTYHYEGAHARFLKAAFRQYVSAEVIEQIVRDPNALTLGGERKELTIFFSDIAGFTSISERLDPAQLVRLLNTFLSRMSSEILREGGTIDKYVGDAIVAFWNAPLSVADHPARGVRAALACLRAQDELSEIIRRDYGVEVKMRIGVHTGSVSVGNFGSTERFNYTVLGDSANLASRLEGANKFFGTALLISEETKSRLPGDIPCRLVGSVVVMGREQPIVVYEPYDPALRPGQSESMLRFHQALSALEAGQFEDAKRGFSALPDDPVARRYLERLATAEGFATKVWKLSEK